jgi:hypothetical protein
LKLYHTVPELLLNEKHVNNADLDRGPTPGTSRPDQTSLPPTQKLRHQDALAVARM